MSLSATHKLRGGVVILVDDTKIDKIRRRLGVGGMKRGVWVILWGVGGSG